MQGKYLHIVAFNVPFPANYGGVIDVFYKIKALHKQGIKIILHCFQYDRLAAKELNLYCDKVFYYKRKMNPLLLLHKKPFIVAGRQSSDLLSRLKADNHPILLEGLHCCAVLEESALSARKIFVRTHNVEHDYYNGLADAEQSVFKKWYFKQEAKKLLNFERSILPKATAILSISAGDSIYFKSNYKASVSHLNAFHGCVLPHDIGNKKSFALYHGNLSVAENSRAVHFLIENVFCGLKEQLLVSGAQPSKALIDLIARHDNVVLKANPTEDEMQTLVSSAQLHVLPTFQSTGVKLKLLKALFSGGLCLVNKAMLNELDVSEVVEVAEGINVWRERVQFLMAENAPKKNQHLLAQVLMKYSDDVAVKQLVKLL